MKNIYELKFLKIGFLEPDPEIWHETSLEKKKKKKNLKQVSFENIEIKISFIQHTFLFSPTKNEYFFSTYQPLCDVSQQLRTSFCFGFFFPLSQK
jgi:hypothetical protein